MCIRDRRQAVIKSLAAKDYYLIQGPPGTGKSFVLGLIIHEGCPILNGCWEMAASLAFGFPTRFSLLRMAWHRRLFWARNLLAMTAAP